MSRWAMRRSGKGLAIDGVLAERRKRQRVYVSAAARGSRTGEATRCLKFAVIRPIEALMKTPQTAVNPQQRAFAFLKLLAEDLSKGQITFPTFVDATMKIRTALNDPEINAGKLSRLVSSEPLLS